MMRRLELTEAEANDLRTVLEAHIDGDGCVYNPKGSPQWLRLWRIWGQLAAAVKKL